jgi:hypothetical protein
MNLNTENYKRKHKEKAVLTFYSVHNVNILMGRNMKSGHPQRSAYFMAQKDTVKPDDQGARFWLRPVFLIGITSCSYKS